MYTTAKNVQIVIALLKEHGINQIVISPGGTNAPFVMGVQDDPFFTCYSVVDERSALYFAIGIYSVTGKPVAMCCTSAQATRNYLPGLTEAYYKHVPILAITFSKHPQYVGQDYMQAPNQTSLPVDCVRKSFALPYVSNEHDRLQCERMANEAMLEIVHTIPAPVQLNIPMLDDELGVYDTETLPAVKVIRRFLSVPAGVRDSLSGKRILVVVGENRGTDIDGEPLRRFAASHNVAIYTNQLSNLRNEFSVDANRMMLWMSQEEFDASYCPDIVITIGGQTGDYPLYHRLSKSRIPYEHWRIAPDGAVVDTYDHLTKIFECGYNEFFSSFAVGKGDKSYLTLLKNVVDAYNANCELPLSNAYLAQQLHDKIPEGSFVNYAILNSLRVWNLFPLVHRCKCFSNVAAFGIDGCMSTFIGQSTQTKALCFLIVGDLSFLYDMNSLGIRHIENNVRIILVNNAGGMEFKYGASNDSCRNIDRFIAAAGHFKDASGWAKTCGFDYTAVRSKTEFAGLASKLIQPANAPVLVEVFVDEKNEDAAFSILRTTNQRHAVSIDNRTLPEKIVGRIKREVKKLI